MIIDLNASNFLWFAMKHYDRTNCVMEEFQNDLNRIKYIKRLFRKYKQTGEIKERLVLNHIIILGNVFGVAGATRMLFFKIEPVDYDILKTFLLFLNYMPKDKVQGINGKNILSSDIAVDLQIAERLRTICHTGQD
jgi:hypothetical protein